MSKSIDEIIGSAAFEQVEKLKKEMGELTDKFDKSAKAATLLDRALSGAKSFKEVTDATTAQKQALTELDKIKGQIETQSKKLAAAQTLEAQLLKGVTMAIQAENQATKDHIKLKQAQEGSLDQLRLKLKQLNAEYSALSAAERENSQAGKDMLANLQRTYTEITKLEQSMGNHTRNVGNYKNSMFSLTQVFRELPAFAYSAQTGFMGISNNLPILTDEFAKLKNEIGPNGKPNGAVGALKLFASSIASFPNIFAIAIGAFTIFLPKILEFINGNKKAKESVEDLEKAMEKQIATNAREITSMQQLYSEATNLKLSYNQRLAAVLELKKAYPEYFKALDNEAIMAGKAKDAYQALNNEMLNNVIYKTFTNEMDRLNNTYAKQIMQLGIAKKALADLETANEGIVGKSPFSMSAAEKQALSQYFNERNILEANLSNANSALRPYFAAQKNLQEYAAQFKSSTKEIFAFKEENRKIDLANDKKAEAERKKSERERLAAEKKAAREKNKLDKDDATAAKEAAKERMEADKAYLELLAERYKRIADNEKNDYATREAALQMFVEKKKQIIDLDRDNVKKNEAEKQQIQEEAEAKIYDFRIAAQKKKISDDELQAEYYVKTYEKEKEAAINSEKQKIDAVKQSYVEGKINKEQYEKEIAKISLESQIAQLEIALKYAEMQTSIAGLPEDQKQKLLKNIKEIKDALLDAQVKLKDSTVSSYQDMAAELEKFYAKAKQFITAFNDLSQSIYQREIEDIERRAKAQDEAYSKEKEAIMNNGATAAANKVRLAQLDAKNEAEKRKFERERVAAERKRAVFQRGVDIAEIVAQTAIAVLKSAPNPLLIAGAAALGAIQLAAVLAQPLPQYAKGRDGGPAEYAIVNEEGPELVRTADGKSYIPNGGKMGVTFLPQGASVITNKELVNMYKVSASDVTPKVTFVQDNTALEQKLDTLIEINKNTKINQTLVFDSEYYSLVKRVVR